MNSGEVVCSPMRCRLVEGVNCGEVKNEMNRALGHLCAHIG